MKKSLYLFTLLIIAFSNSFSQLSYTEESILKKVLLQEVNNLRKSKKLIPLQVDNNLELAAKKHSSYMLNHQVVNNWQNDQKTSTPSLRVENYGNKTYNNVCENILISSYFSTSDTVNAIRRLAKNMFLQWKNSPAHYQNLVNPKLKLTGFGFAFEKGKKDVYATQIFGKKAYIVQNQQSDNSFNLKKAPINCDDEYSTFKNLVYNYGNAWEIVDGEIILYASNRTWFDKIFQDPNDGIAVDAIHQSQLVCNEENKLDYHELYDGVLLKPVYTKQLNDGNLAHNPNRIKTSLGKLPVNIPQDNLSLSLVLINNGEACMYLVPNTTPSKTFPLFDIEPELILHKDVPLKEEGIIEVDEYDFFYNPEETVPLDIIFVQKRNFDIDQITLNVYSSIEGDSTNNEDLAQERARYLINTISSQLNVDSTQITVNAKVNWDLMRYQLRLHQKYNYLSLSEDELKKKMLNDKSVDWNSLLFAQRKSTLTVKYKTKEENTSENESTLPIISLLTGIYDNDIKLINNALYHFYENKDLNEVLFTNYTFSYILNYPELYQNYAAILSLKYDEDPSLVATFLRQVRTNLRSLNQTSLKNIVSLYSLYTDDLLNNWDIDEEVLNNMLSPKEVLEMTKTNEKDLTTINLYMVLLKYYGALNSSNGINTYFNKIVSYFRTRTNTVEESVNLALFFNKWSIYQLAVDELYPIYKAGKLNEEGTFVLMKTLPFSNKKEDVELFIELNKICSNLNTNRWCKIVEKEFQMLRHQKIKEWKCLLCD